MRAWEVEAFFWADLWKRRHINLWLMIPFMPGNIFIFWSIQFSFFFLLFVRGAAICLLCLHSKISLIESHICRIFVRIFTCSSLWTIGRNKQSKRRNKLKVNHVQWTLMGGDASRPTPYGRLMLLFVSWQQLTDLSLTSIDFKTWFNLTLESLRKHGYFVPSSSRQHHWYAVPAPYIRIPRQS